MRTKDKDDEEEDEEQNEEDEDEEEEVFWNSLPFLQWESFVTNMINKWNCSNSYIHILPWKLED